MGFRDSVFRGRCRGSVFLVQGFSLRCFQVRGEGFEVRDFGCRVLQFGVSGSGFHDSGFRRSGFRVPGFGGATFRGSGCGVSMIWVQSFALRGFELLGEGFRVWDLEVRDF